MGLVLTANGTVTCGHGGQAKPSGQGKLTVDGAVVMTQGDVTSWSIAPGCSQTNSNNGELPCLTFVSVSGGTSKKLTVGGSAVVLEDFSATTNGKPQSTDSAVSAPGQGLLSAK